MSSSGRCLRLVHALWQRKTLASSLLLPLSWLVYLYIVVKRRHFRKRTLATETPVPVIVVGNILVGGTGKTPVVMAILKDLKKKGWNPGVISRGYGVTIKGPPICGKGAISASLIGDEPALIASTSGVPVAVHPRRLLALSALCTKYPEVDIVVSDDGLQHLELPRTIEIVVQDERGIGNGRLLPAGPLREPASRLRDIDFLIHNQTTGKSRPTHPHLPNVSQIDMLLVPESVQNLVDGRRLIWSDWLVRHSTCSLAAVAAIGQPERFFSMLQSSGLQLTEQLALPDHANYQNPPFINLTAEVILITAKDAIKCGHINDSRLWVVNVCTQFSDGSVWLDELTDTLTKK